MSLISNNKKVEVPSIKVDKNIIKYANSFICIDNISLITISAIPAKSFIGAVLLGILGICLIPVAGIGVIPLIIALIWLIYVLRYNANRGENLEISLNSGMNLYFNCKDREFLNRVINVIINSIKDKNKSTYTISFDKCTISDMVVNENNN